MEYAATTKAAGEKIHIEVAISSESLPNQKIDKKLEEEIKKVKKNKKTYWQIGWRMLKYYLSLTERYNGEISKWS